MKTIDEQLEEALARITQLESDATASASLLTESGHQHERFRQEIAALTKEKETLTLANGELTDQRDQLSRDLATAKESLKTQRLWRRPAESLNPSRGSGDVPALRLRPTRKPFMFPPEFPARRDIPCATEPKPPLPRTRSALTFWKCLDKRKHQQCRNKSTRRQTRPFHRRFPVRRTTHRERATNRTPVSPQGSHHWHLRWHSSGRHHCIHRSLRCRLRIEIRPWRMEHFAFNGCARPVVLFSHCSSPRPCVCTYDTIW